MYFNLDIADIASKIMSKVVIELYNPNNMAKQDIRGIELAITAEEAYANPRKIGNSVVIISTSIAGAELGIYLAGLGKTVTLVVNTGKLDDGGRPEYLKRVHYNMVSSGIDARCGTRVFEISDKGVDCDSGFLEADTVVYAE